MGREWTVLLGLLVAGALILLPAAAQEAQELSDVTLVTDSEGFPDVARLFDGKTQSGLAAEAGAKLTLEAPEGIGSLYLIFDYQSGRYTITNNETGETADWGENNFAHDFVDLTALFGGSVDSVTLSFAGEQTRLWEIDVFSEGTVPDFVQQWRPPWEEGADLALFSTHGDDEQLFFAGLLPEYAGERGYRVQVIYLTNHRNMTTVRVHEMLNGLWAVGVRAYPVFGEFDDFLTYDRDEAYRTFERLGWPKETLVGFVVEQLRRFRPLVAVGHDFAGEYGHGQHMVYADLLAQAVALSPDPDAYPESRERWGVWEVPKTYFHLYRENPILLDWDQPLEHFDGLTAFEVTKQRGFPCHETQQYPVFRRQLYLFDRAAEVDRYNPCAFGLYRSQVGEDQEKNDFMEHLLSYDRQQEIAVREAKRLATMRGYKQWEENLLEQRRQEELEFRQRLFQEHTQHQRAITEMALAGLTFLAVVGTAAIVWKRFPGAAPGNL